MKLINLTKGYKCKVSDDQYEALSKFKWHAHESNKKIYAVRCRWNGEKDVFIYMHREIMGFPHGRVIDHINGDGLDNQRDNLRACSHADNIRNANWRLPNKRSKYRGISWHKASNLWHCRIRDNKEISIGYYKNEIEAALAYNVASSFRFREFSRLNDLNKELAR